VGRTWIRVALAVGVLVALLSTAANASAMRTHLRLAQLHVKASHGYDAYIDAIRRTHPRSQARISVLVARDQAIALYRVRGTFTGSRLKARFGELGRISIRFHHRAHSVRAKTESGEQARSKRDIFRRAVECAVEFSSEPGTFSGRIDFHGEGNYTRIHMRKANGYVGSGTSHCSKGKPTHGTALTASAGSLRFNASHLRRDSHSFFSASVREALGRVAIIRYAFDKGGKRSFTHNSRLTTSHVHPAGSPFSGSADYKSPDEWTGPLSVSFPGEPDMSLTGPGFTVGLRRF
jgi:hypothetical protein